MKIILASSSPRRIEFMQKLVKDFEIRFPTSEEILDEAKDAKENSQALATQKARECFEEGSITLGFDTLGEVDGKFFGKPPTSIEAMQMLKNLSGKTHQVISSFCVKSDKGEKVGSEIASVKFRKLSEKEIENYVSKNPTTSYAGGYAIQTQARDFVESYEGELSTIIGFPYRSIEKLLAL